MTSEFALRLTMALIIIIGMTTALGLGAILTDEILPRIPVIGPLIDKLCGVDEDERRIRNAYK